ncbi:N-acetylated-alpha-linked acidic dipeptidase [Algoriphagus ornithinivorans]|uniref:N-acetylated-alpha-linked acidic dipeptidase n=1 Tax=Algoriphagus ornithinivorans TaxID=226506 RepID=A0A1I5GTT4_9BACT|nr:M28 family metallopeptidase [Algoriphagus ornithinivorans]SFO38991.1 N-acetylated-alpha-linked acidic dipeptidase [Algoriphagus ornithinivorans]
MNLNKTTLLLFGALSVSISLQAQDGFFSKSQAKQKSVEAAYLKSVNYDRFKVHLQELTKNPHIAGTPENELVQQYMAKIMEDAGMSVKLYPYDVYLPNDPGESHLEIVSPVLMKLSQQEAVLEEDPFSSDPRLHLGFNAFSGSGDVTAEVVYVNYGTREDFQKLKEMGIELTGKVAIARYGGNFRGYKAKFAEQAGAIGLVVYTDPKDNGFTKGDVYPDGPYYNETTIQRGSMLTLDWTGDPLTPYEPALPLDGPVKVDRLDPKDVALHKIPVTPIGYGAAKEILSRMTGQAVPKEWQGGLPFDYKIEGGSDLKVRVMVDQPTNFIRANNVIGTFEGARYPDEWIILGSHFDAWSFGATDPNSGTAMLLTLAEALGELVKNGERPARSIMIGHWDAEEQGVIGSTEWVEHFRDELGAKAVTYMNFDGGVSGRNFGASAAPTLKKLIIDASKEVMYPDSAKTVFQVWAGDKKEPGIGNLGGGSDHIAFYMHVGVPSLSGGAGGISAYHSNYDNFHYYSKFVDPSFKMGGAVAQLFGLVALRMANGEVIPYDVPRYAQDLKGHFAQAVKNVQGIAPDFKEFDLVNAALNKLESSSTAYQAKLNAALNKGNLSASKIKSINQQLIGLEKSWIDPQGMYYGDWYKSLYVCNDPFSGYASWILPGIQYEVAIERTEKLEEWDERYAAAILNLAEKIDRISASL